MATPVSPSDPLPAPAAAGLSRGDHAWLAASALLPALVVASQLDLDAGGGRDAGVVRAVGLGYAGSFRALDAWLGGLFAALPLGTRVLRAEIPGALLLASAAALTFVIAYRLLSVAHVPSRRGPSPAWRAVVAAIATATVSLSFPFQQEGACPASCLVGVVLVLATLVHVDARDGAAPSVPLLAGLFVLAASYDPAVGACVAVAAIAGLVSRVLSPTRPPPRTAAPVLVPAIVAGAAGLIPFGLATLHAPVTRLSTSARALAPPTPAGAATAAPAFLAGLRHALGLLRAELGDVLLLLATVGVFIALLRGPARRSALPIAAVTACACAALSVSARGGTPDPWTGGNPAGLVALAGVVVFAGVAMHAAVVGVAQARLPLAGASATMVVLLEAAFPAVLLDDGLARASRRAALALPAWEDAAFSGLPGGTVVVVSAPRLYARLLATEATGALPGDLTLIPTFDPSNEAAAAALARDERLVPLFRDIVLAGVPAELSMSTLAAVKPLAVASDPRWERTLSRHLIPAGLLSLFEPEPRGGADRKRALEASAPARARLASALGLHPADGQASDAALSALTAAMLFDRALGAVIAGEREVALRALDDAAVFAPKDARIARLSLAVAAAKGPVDVHDLVREGLAGEAP